MKTALLISLSLITMLVWNNAIESMGILETEMKTVCDSVSMETYFISCMDAAMKEDSLGDTGHRFWKEECRTQAIQLHCEETLHVLYKGEWIPCDSLSLKKRMKFCE